MKKLFIAGMAVAELIGGPAMAADMRPPPPPVEYFTWTGGYVGVNLGGGWRQPANFVTTMPSCTNLATCLIVDPDTGLASSLGTGPSTRGKGMTGGFQGGYNYQIGAAVVGVEFDWEYFKRTSFLAKTGIMAADGEAGLPITATNDVTSTWLATVRGRLGYAWDRLLVYATGGVAFTDVRYAQTIATPFFGGTAINVVTQTKSGGTVGAGAEYALWNHLTVRAEYLYAQFSGVTETGVLSGPSTAPPPAFFTNVFTGSTGTLRDHIVRIGLNYKFTYGGAVGSY